MNLWKIQIHFFYVKNYFYLNSNKHLTYAERTMIERWYNRDHLTKREIAKNLDKNERTIRREIKRGLTINLTSEYEEIEVYSADIVQEEYEKNLKAKGQDLKIGSDIEIVKRIEKMIKEEKNHQR